MAWDMLYVCKSAPGDGGRGRILYYYIPLPFCVASNTQHVPCLLSISAITPSQRFGLYSTQLSHAIDRCPVRTQSFEPQSQRWQLNVGSVPMNWFQSAPSARPACHRLHPHLHPFFDHQLFVSLCVCFGFSVMYVYLQGHIHQNVLCSHSFHPSIPPSFPSTHIFLLLSCGIVHPLLCIVLCRCFFAACRSGPSPHSHYRAASPSVCTDAALSSTMQPRHNVHLCWSIGARLWRVQYFHGV